MLLKPPGGLRGPFGFFGVSSWSPAPPTLLRYTSTCHTAITDSSSTIGVLRPFPYRKQSWDFFTRNSDSLAGTFRWSEDSSWAWLVPSTA
jgi:hypothetical protein